MNTKTLLGVSFAAVFTVSMLAAPAFAGVDSFLNIEDVDTEIKTNDRNPTGKTNERIKVTIETKGDIPIDGTSGFGYGILTDGSIDNVLVLVTHLPIDDSDHEDPTSGLHTHVLDLEGPDSECGGADLQVDLEGSVANKGFDLNAHWEVDGDTATVGFTPTKRLNDSTDVVVAPFTVDAVFDGPSLTHICVTLTEAPTPSD